MANQIVWCDIPVLYLDRAVKFSAVLAGKSRSRSFRESPWGLLHNDGELGGCLVQSSAEKPSDGGVMI
jgi:predicted enzyme related to lactoylglutathione lyase